MEKLQQALEKARQQRVGGGTPRRVSARQPAEDAWANLAPVRKPDRAILNRNRIIADSAGAASTPFDILRTKVLVTMAKKEWRRLAVTSPSAGTGKTTTACNLALAIGRQSDLKVILLEMDLRQPSIRRHLALGEGPDIAELLRAEVSFADQAVRIGPNVAVCAANTAQRDPTALLLSDTTRRVLRNIEADYAPDVMIFDLPPLLVSDDAQAFLKEVDCALMIARAEKTTMSQIDTCEREIAQETNVLGVVLNRCKYADEMVGGYGYSSGD